MVSHFAVLVGNAVQPAPGATCSLELPMLERGLRTGCLGLRTGEDLDNSPATAFPRGRCKACCCLLSSDARACFLVVLA